MRDVAALAVGAGLALVVAGCSSSATPSASPSPSAPVTSPPSSLPVTSAVAPATSSAASPAASPVATSAAPSHSAVASAACVNSVASASVKALLITADARPGATEVAGSTFYGMCGSTSYAVASFMPSATATEQDSVAFQDDGAEPEFFTRAGAGPWKVVGRAPGPPSSPTCATFATLPATLKTLWKDCVFTVPADADQAAIDAKSQAAFEWQSGATADAASQGGYWIKAATDLEAAVSANDAGVTGFATAAHELRDLASLPDTMLTPAQMAEAHADVSALDARIATPGLYS